jgi:hypothetical protein
VAETSSSRQGSSVQLCISSGPGCGICAGTYRLASVELVILEVGDDLREVKRLLVFSVVAKMISANLLCETLGTLLESLDLVWVLLLKMRLDGLHVCLERCKV